MAYIGRGTESISNVEVLDNLTFDGSASYTLQKSSVNFVPSSANNLLISISGVVQQGNFTVSGSTITFDTTVSASDTCDWILHYGTGLITTVADGAITEAKLGNGAVTNAKLANSSVTVNGTSIALGASGTITAGKIGQIVSATHTTDNSTTSTSFVDVSGFNATITPTATSSKVYIIVDTSFFNAGSSQGNQSLIRLVRGSSTELVQRRAINYSQDGNGVESDNNTTIAYLDSPSTASAVTYKLQMRLNFGSSCSVNHSSGKTGSFTLMEVLA